MSVLLYSVRGQPRFESEGVRLLRRDGKWRGHLWKVYGMGNTVGTVFERYNLPQYSVTIN